MKTIATKVNTNAATSGNANTNISTVAVIKTEQNLSMNVPDNNLQFQTPLTTNSTLIGSGNINKRPASLAINKDAPLIKKRSVAPSPLLVDSTLSADKTLDTPEISEIFLANALIQTPQPGVVFPTKVGTVTTEQEEYARGFEDALHNLHSREHSHTQLNSNNNNTNINQNSNTNVTNPTAATTNVSITTTSTAGTGLSGGSFTYTNLDTFPVTIKDEPQNLPTSSPVSPIDMETQEKIKLERKRQRNRVAASKCRRRKLERISKLEDNVKILKGENVDLAGIVKTLKEHVAQLKQEVLEHFEAGCVISAMK